VRPLVVGALPALLAGLPPMAEWNDMNLRWPGIDHLVFPSPCPPRFSRKPHGRIRLRINFLPELQKSVDNL
jgi:hypothetical protein